MHPGHHDFEVIEIMKQEDAGVVPVTENGRLTCVVASNGDDTKNSQVVEEISE